VVFVNAGEPPHKYHLVPDPRAAIPVDEHGTVPVVSTCRGAQVL